MFLYGKQIRYVVPVAAVAVAGISLIRLGLFSKDQSVDSSIYQKSQVARQQEHHKRRQADSTARRPPSLAEIRRLLDAVEPVGHGELRNDDVIALLRSLAEHDPAVAIMFAAEHSELHGQLDLAAELFGGWLEGNELAARDWLGGIPAGELRQQVVPVLVAHLASDQPEEALALAGELPGYDGALDPLRSFGNWNHGDEIEGRVREQAYAGIFGEWAGSDPLAAAARANGLEDPLLRNLAMQALAFKWIRKDPEAAVEWMNHLPAGEDRNSALQGLVPEWTAQAPQAAAAFLETIHEGPERSEWLRMLGENWSSSDPKTALDWALKLPGEGERNQLVQTVLAKVAETGGRQAADFVLTIPAGAARAQSMEMVLTRWRAEDTEAVSAWVNALPQGALREEARAILPVE